MNRRGFLTALIGGAVTSVAVVVDTANAQFFGPFEPPEWEDRRDRYRRYRYERERERYRREREWRRRSYRRRWRDDDDDDD